MKFEMLDITFIKPYSKNTKLHPKSQVDKIKKSILEFGFTNPILLDKDKEVIAGHGRLMAAKELQLDKVPVVYLEDLTEAQVKAYRIADNRLAESDWDEELLKQEFMDLKSLDFDLSLTGFDLTEVGQYVKGLNDVVEVEAEEAENIETDIKLGNLIQLGNHKLMCGDSTNKLMIENLIYGHKISGVYTDPPYGINLEGDNSKRGKDTSLMKGGLNLKSFKDDSTIYAEEAFKIIDELDILKQVWWGANYYAHSIPQSNNWLVWDKRVEEKMNNTNSDCELAWVKNEHNSVRIFRHLWNGLIKASEHGQRRVHPTQKPVALAAFCFDKYDMGNNIPDLFGGSGSTLIACEQLNRKCFMMEIDPHYCEVIARRWEKLTGLKRVHLN